MNDVLDKRQTEKAVKTLQAEWSRPAVPLPLVDIEFLKHAALGDTGQSRSVRYLLFFLLPGLEEPSGFKGEGLKELRALNGKLADAFLKVLLW